MDADEYKRTAKIYPFSKTTSKTIEAYKRTASPYRFSKTTLEEILDILRSLNAKETSVIEEAFRKGGVGNPYTHDGKDDYNYFLVNCTWDEAHEIWDHLTNAETNSIAPHGGVTPETKRIGRLVGIWTLFCDSISDG
jgi:hypothetical protein